MTAQNSATPLPRVTAIIVAAGQGLRAGGGLPKQFRDLGGMTVLARSLRAFAQHPAIDEIVVVRRPEDAPQIAASLPDPDQPPILVPGGATRDASVRAGLDVALGARVLIHDAARPLVSADLIDRVLAALDSHDGAAPGLAVTDALWRGDGDRVVGLADRAGLWRAQTPQGFDRAQITAAHAAHAAHASTPGPAADDVAVALQAGLSVAIVPGDVDNFKLTVQADFDRAARLIGDTKMDIRVGNGFDVHRFGPGDHVMLCGVSIPHGRGLQGHSDADVGLHTLSDAIYGALAAGDIGTHFPPSDPQWRGAESHIFLRHAGDLARTRGYRITHVDLTLICERPKIGAHAPAMRARVAEILDLDIARVSVKATTTERLGFAGREEGIAAQATATLVRA